MNGFTENPEEVKEEIVKHFESAYTSGSCARPTLDGVNLVSISSIRVDWSEREFEE